MKSLQFHRGIASWRVLTTFLLLAMIGVPWHFAAGADQGEKAYQQGKYKQAVDYYKKMLEKRDTPETSYNLGSALHKAGDYDESVRMFEQSLSVKQPEKKFDVMYNLGNSLAKAGKLKESAAFYRRALELNPSDMDTKYNLELVQRQLQKQQKQSPQSSQDKQQDQKQQQQRKQRQQEQKQQGQQKQNQDQQSQQNNQQQQEQQQDQGEQQAQNKPQQGSQPDQQQQQQGAQPEKKSLDEQEADQILNALRVDQDKVMKAQIQKRLKKVQTEKDW